MNLIRAILITDLVLSLLLASFPTTTYGQPPTAQQAATSLEWLTVDLWPDYDRAAVLVLLTGSVAADAPLPASVTLPLPPEASINAVARIADDNEMIDDIAFERDDGALTLTTPDRRFRVEYYMPYQSQGLQRTLTFNWSGGPAVTQLNVGVQQPRAATSISVRPTPESVISGNDGLQYHNLPVRQLAANEDFEVDVDYTMSSDQLTAATQPTESTGDGAPSDESSAGLLSDANWPLILGGLGIVLLLLAIGWQVFGARLTTRQKPRKPRPLRAMRQNEVKYCHQCGTRAQAGDRFCRECGTELKKS